MRSRFILAFAFNLASAAAAFGQNWNNPAGGSWEDATNWSGDAVPSAPVFNLNSSSGYTVTLASSHVVNSVTVQTDMTTISLNGDFISSPVLQVSTNAGQNGSLTLLGPGTFGSTGSGGGVGSGSVDVGDNGGTGQLILNDVTLFQGGEVTGQHFDVNGLVVENGAYVDLQTPGPSNVTISNATFNDGMFSAPTGYSLSASQLVLTNNSNVGADNISLNNASLDDSKIEGSNSTSVGGTVTLSDGSSLVDPDITISGMVTVHAGTFFGGASQMVMQNGTISVELNGQVSKPITRPSTFNNGTLDFTLQNGFVPTIGEQFDIFVPDPSTETGTFATVNLPSLPAGESWDISNLYTNDTITVVPEPMSMGIVAIGIAGLALRRRARGIAGCTTTAIIPPNEAAGHFFRP